MAGLFLSGRRSLSGEEMFQRGGRAATGLAQLGMGEGDAVAMLLRNDFPFIEATIATQALNAFAVAINCPAANWAIPPGTSIVRRLQAQLDEIRESGHKLPGHAQLAMIQRGMASAFPNRT